MDAESAPPVSPADIEDFRRDGVVCLRGAISPGVDMPISKTARSVSSGMRASVSGTPQ